MAKGVAAVCKLNKKAPILDGGNSFTTKRNSINHNWIRLCSFSVAMLIHAYIYKTFKKNHMLH